jgi:hypothetical protein
MNKPALDETGALTLIVEATEAFSTLPPTLTIAEQRGACLLLRQLFLAAEPLLPRDRPELRDVFAMIDTIKRSAAAFGIHP